MSTNEKHCYCCNQPLGVPATATGSLADDCGACAQCLALLKAEVERIGGVSQSFRAELPTQPEARKSDGR